MTVIFPESIERKFQQQDFIIRQTDLLLRAWKDAYETKDWSKVNYLRKDVQDRIDEYFEREKKKKKES